jgi:hypothetical protein
MDLSRVPPVSRRLDYVLQALEDVCKKLDKISDTLVAMNEKTLKSLGPRPLLSLKEAAAALGVGVGTMRALAGSEITYVKIGHRTSFSPEDIGSSRWLGKGRRRYGGDEAADQKYMERISRPDPSEKMPPLEKDFEDALVAFGVNLNARRALRLAGVASIAKAQTFSYDELCSIRGISINTAPWILKAVGKPVPKGMDPEKWR